MAEPMLLPWRKMWDFMAACSDSPDLPGLMKRAVCELPRVISCDHALAIHVTSLLGKVCVTVENNGAPREAVEAYRQRYFFEDSARLALGRSSVTYQFDWTDGRLQAVGFVRDFVRGLMKIDMSAGMPTWSEDGTSALNVLLTRTRVRSLSRRDEAILRALHCRLARQHFLLDWVARLPATSYLAVELSSEGGLLSRREAQIAGLLCKRLPIHDIASLLLISPRTVETHVQHIYGKLHLNSRAELLRCLMGRREGD